MDKFRGLWRGKRVVNNEWLYGVPLQHYDGDWQLISGKVGTMVIQTVITDTLGECTGLRDKNGKLIFEGDILKYYDDKNDLGLVCFGDYGFYKLNVNHMGFYALRNTRERGIYWGCPDRSLECAEIIGNIHDNPELLNGGK